MAQRVCCRPLTAKALIKAGSVRVGFVVDKVALRKIFLFPSTSAFNCQHHSTSAPHSSLPYYYCHQKDKRPNPGNLTKTLLVWISGIMWTEKYSLFFGHQRFSGISTLPTSGDCMYRMINVRWHVRSSFV